MNKEPVSLSTPSQPQTLTLEEVAEHFEDWRRQKRRGERIPEQLWSEAIALVEAYGLSQVTRRLRLSGRDLNKRRGLPGSGRRRARRAEALKIAQWFCSKEILNDSVRSAGAMLLAMLARGTDRAAETDPRRARSLTAFSCPSSPQ